MIIKNQKNDYKLANDFIVSLEAEENLFRQFIPQS